MQHSRDGQDFAIHMMAEDIDKQRANVYKAHHINAAEAQHTQQTARNTTHYIGWHCCIKVQWNLP